MMRTKTPVAGDVEDGSGGCPNRLVDVRVIAARLSLSTRQVWRLADSGSMPNALYIGRSRRWREREINQWIANGCRPVENR